MTQQERDRLVTLKKAKKKLITQRQAAEEMGVTERHVRRMLKALAKRGDKAVVHALRGKPSNARIASETSKRIVGILSTDMYRDFGPTLAAEYLRKQHDIEIGREALRQLMTEAGLWHPKPRKSKKQHHWRERKARFGEMVQWDTSDHDWLEGRGERLYLVHMIDDATSRLLARFVRSDSTEQNMRLLWTWVERYGRPLAFYTDKAAMFYNAPKRVDGADATEMAPTQIGRALQELQIAGILAHSPQAKGRVERSFQTAQDRLVKGMRVAGVKTIEEANAYLERDFLPWWQAECTVAPAHPDDAHKPVGKQGELTAALSFAHSRHIANDHTFRFGGRQYRIERKDVLPGMRSGHIRVEQRLDGTMAARFQDKYVDFSACPVVTVAETPPPPARAAKARRKPTKPNARSKAFNLKKTPSWREIYKSGALNRI
jgi:transposase